VALAVRSVTLGRGVLFIVNDRVDVAMACGADGVHLGQDDLPVSEARRLMGREAVIGVSVDGVGQALAAQADGASYVAVGPIFETTTKPDAGSALGTGVIEDVKRAVRVPVVAIGGITVQTIESVAAAGADSAAVVTAVTRADDLQTAVRTLVEAFRRGEDGRGTR
jgi:thiamine-phosphate pyrophosphorylase